MDLVQSRHAVLRNYPLTAHIRFILEEIRPEIRQYFLESEKDGRPFSRRYQIENVLRSAASLHQPWRILECVCKEETAKARLAAPSDHPAGNRDLALYDDVRGRFETILEPKAVVNTDLPIEECIRCAMAVLH
jgi:hypothetical protein